MQRLGATLDVAWDLNSCNPLPLWDYARMDTEALKALGSLMPGHPFNAQAVLPRFAEHTPEATKRALALYVSEHLHSLAEQAMRPFNFLHYIPVERGLEVNGKATAGLLRDLRSPGPADQHHRRAFMRVVEFARDLLRAPHLELDVMAREDRIQVSMRGDEEYVPLESLGTGVQHLVLLGVALALNDGCVVCIEEPEHNLHPDLQRKFLQFLLKETQSTYFITTHSNVFLDDREDVAVFHVSHDGVRSAVERVHWPAGAREVLADLGYKASDLLQTNGVIWVEGPSDRYYLMKWMSLLDEELLDNVHFTFAFYGGSVLSHFCGDEHNPTGDFMQVLRLNRNALVMMDRDGDDETSPLSPGKRRVLDTLGEHRCWVTKGREVENYLPAGLLERYLAKRYRKTITVPFTLNDEIEKVLARVTAEESQPVSFDKVDYAKKFTELMTGDDLAGLDLRDRVRQVVEHVRGWNGMPPPRWEKAS